MEYLGILKSAGQRYGSRWCLTDLMWPIGSLNHIDIRPPAPSSSIVVITEWPVMVREALCCYSRNVKLMNLLSSAESSDDDDASGDEGLRDDDSDVSP